MSVRAQITKQRVVDVENNRLRIVNLSAALLGGALFDFFLRPLFSVFCFLRSRFQVVT